jgi:hypothetical protein
MLITEGRNEEDLKYTYVYGFDKFMISIRAWNALIVLENKVCFDFLNFGDRGYHSLVDNV